MSTKPAGAVLAGYDGSPEAWQAVDWAASEAELRGKPLILAHSADWHWPATGLGTAMVVSTWEDTGRVRDAMGTQLLEAAAAVRHTRPWLDVRTALPEGPPEMGLPAIADEVGPVLIAVGASGADSLSRTLLGSAATDLVRRTPWPAVVVRGAGGGAHDTALRPVVVGLDGSATSDRAAEFAFKFAVAHGTSVRVVHAEPAFDPGTSLGALAGHPAPAQAVLDAASEVVGEQVRTWLERCPDVPVETAQVSGQPAQALLDRAHDAALLVVGSHGRGAFRRLLLGSVSHHVVHHSPCPVAVLRASAAA